MKLHVFGEIDGTRHLVGTLQTVPGKEEQFTYSPQFRDSFPQSPLSVALPLSAGSFPARPTRAFFRNLLPEGAALAAVARALEVKSASYLKVLNALGTECIGAVILGNSEDTAGSDGHYVPISREALHKTMEGGADGIAELQEEAKLSLAGAQSKMGLYAESRGGSISYAIPMEGAASTHIVKAPNRRFEQLSENEHFCLLLAKRAELRTADSTIDILGEDAIYVTERFDRELATFEKNSDVEGSLRVLRLHQEDFCQILGKLPEQKYEKPGQQYARLVRDTILANSSDPLGDMDQFVRMLIVNVIVGNCDGHLKNLTALRGGDWRQFRLAPAYDIASTVIYKGLDRHMAMRIGGTNKIDAVSKEDFLALAKELSLSPKAMARLLDEVCSHMSTSIGTEAAALEDALGRPLGKVWEIVEFARVQIDRIGA